MCIDIHIHTHTHFTYLEKVIHQLFFLKRTNSIVEKEKKNR